MSKCILLLCCVSGLVVLQVNGATTDQPNPTDDPLPTNAPTDPPIDPEEQARRLREIEQRRILEEERRRLEEERIRRLLEAEKQKELLEKRKQLEEAERAELLRQRKIQALSVNPVFVQLCKTLDHLKKDYLRFLQLHKDIIAPIENGTNAPVVMEANALWEQFARLNALICDLEEKKEAMIADRLDVNDLSLVENLMTWTGDVLGQTAALFNSAQSLRSLAKNNGALDESLVDELAVTIAKCLEVSQDGLIESLIERTDFFMTQNSTAGQFQEICDKIKALQMLCKGLLMAFRDIRATLLEKFLDDQLVLYPSQLQYDFCKCIFQLCRLVRDLMVICKEAENPDVSPVKIEKQICDWLLQAMEVRESLRDCLEAIPGSIRSAILKVPGKKIGGEKKKKVASRCFDKVAAKVAGIVARFDFCVRQVRCAYIDLVKARLTVK